MDQMDMARKGVHSVKEMGWDRNRLRINLSNDELIKRTLDRKEGELAHNGALVVKTGVFTGRAAKDKYVVKSPSTREKIWWENSLNAMSPSSFQKLKDKVLQYLSEREEIYITENSVGAHPRYNMGVCLITTHPSHALFSNYLFRKNNPSVKETFTILHAPLLELDPNEFDLKRNVVITTCFDSKITIIVGTCYAGEIKKSMFSVMNYLLPENGILPMHAGVNEGNSRDVSVFFGLSGTGKTTLSTDKGKKLIGDDEHGLSDHGVFNFEGGCYAKTYKLSSSAEPDIYKASTQKGSLLENVVVRDGKLDFHDSSITENGRSSYPLDFIPDIVKDSKGDIPKNIFFLTADAFGVLPPIARLDKDQAMFYFVLGYTAKVAGTEIGVKEPQTTFSPCFGAPFMLRHPKVYANLLGKYIEKHNIPVWLVNTGWGGGAYGEGSRYAIDFTRKIIRTIQKGDVNEKDMETEPWFGLSIPKKLADLDSSLLNPQKNWADENLYKEKAKNLARSFQEQMRKFEDISR